MKKFALLVIAVVATAASAAEWFDAAWQYRNEIRVREGFYVLSDDLKGFPLCVNLSGDDFPLHSCPDGYDIVFTDAGGKTEIPSEMEYFNPAARECVCWVRLPLLKGEGDTKIFVYYGNGNKVRRMQGSVWDNKFASVWHLQGRSAEGGTVSMDSTGTGNNLRIESGTPGFVPGKIGQGASFDGKARLISCKNLSMPSGGSASFTISFWIYCSRNPLQVNQGWGNFVRGGSFSAYHHPNGRWQLLLEGEDKKYYVFVPAEKAEKAWHYLAFTYEAEMKTLQLYVDGNKGGDASALAKDVKMGRLAEDKPVWISCPEGIIDEVRISGVARSGEWISACYKNQSNPGSYVKIGNREKR